jgi:hypothetical protein
VPDPFGLKQPTPTGLTAVTDTTLFNNALQQLEKFYSNVTFNVAYFQLVLGDQDTTTGWHKVGYVRKTIRMGIMQPNIAYVVTGAGYQSSADRVAITNHRVSTGSVVQSEAGAFYTIMAIGPVEWGSRVGYYVCDLKEQPDFEVVGDFFGFVTYTYVSKYKVSSSQFKDGFQRGFWT